MHSLYPLQEKAEHTWFYVSKEYQPAMYKAMEDSVGERAERNIMLCMTSNAWERQQAKHPAGAYGPSATQMNENIQG